MARLQVPLKYLYTRSNPGLDPVQPFLRGRDTQQRGLFFFSELISKESDAVYDCRKFWTDVADCYQPNSPQMDRNATFLRRRGVFFSPPAALKVPSP